MVISIESCSVPNIVSLVVVPDLKKDNESRKNSRTGVDAEFRWGFRPIHKFLTLDQRWEVATACPALLGNQQFVKQILIRVDASAEDIDLEFDADARLAHIARLEECVIQINRSRLASHDATLKDEEDFFINTLLSALAVHRLQVFVGNEKWQADAEKTVLLLLRKFRWEFSSVDEGKRKGNFRRLSSNPKIQNRWPLLSKIPPNESLRVYSPVLRNLFSDPSHSPRTISRASMTLVDIPRFSPL